MDPHQRESMRRVRRSSVNVLQDLFSRGVRRGDGDAPIAAQLGRDSKTIHSIASLIRGKSQLLLLEGPDTVEVYKLNQPTPHSSGAGTDSLYLPAITKKTSTLTAMKGALTQSCPYLYDKRRGSFSSSVGSRGTGIRPKKQSGLKARREAKKSNVTVTMTFLGQGRAESGSSPEELKVLQQVNGGENICVFKGWVTAGEQFQFVSQRHGGFPFSAALYVSGLMAARISSCCEYRYAPGPRRGEGGCFRLTWLSGGMPCHRCTSLRNKYGSCQQLNNGTKRSSTPPPDQSPGHDPVRSRPSSPLSVPAKPERKAAAAAARKRAEAREGGGPSTDSEGPALAAGQGSSKPRRRKGRSGRKQGEAAAGTGGGRRRSPLPSDGRARREARGRGCDRSRRGTESGGAQGTPQEEPRQEFNKTAAAPSSLRDGEEALTKHKEEEEKEEVAEEKEPGSDGKSRDGEQARDFYKECVEMSCALERSPSKHRGFKGNILQRCRLQKRLASRPKASSSDVELSEESDGDGVPLSQEAPGEPGVAPQSPRGTEARPEQELQAQLDAMAVVLRASDEVEQLVLRNTGLTDDLLLDLTAALKGSPSEVTLLNLNLNRIGPYGAHILLDMLRAKPQLRGLHLFGNKLRDHGIQTLLGGIAELQEQTVRAAAVQQAALLQPALAGPPPAWGPLKIFTLLELDVGGNGLGSDGLKVLASYIRRYSFLRYLGLARTSGADLAAWKELFDSLKGSDSLTQIILDESNLGDPGTRMLAEALKANLSLRRVDLDGNAVSDVGGNDIMEALLCRTQFPLSHLSLQENNISAGLMSRIQEEVKCD